MNMITVTGIAVIAAAFSVLLKQKNPEYSLMISLAAGVLLIGMMISSAVPLLERIKSLLEQTGSQGEAVRILMKSLGICFITQITCDGCRDLGERALASKVETAGKIAVLLISLPLFEQILQIASNLIG